MISTASMVRLGKVHGNRMIDVAITNQKLHARAVAIVMDLVDCDRERAAQLLADADDEVKTAVLMGLRDLDADRARRALGASDGVLRTALSAGPPS
jgi:N-acetylmuramic acid 6-phosphate etherase